MGAVGVSWREVWGGLLEKVSLRELKGGLRAAVATLVITLSF